MAWGLRILGKVLTVPVAFETKIEVITIFAAISGANYELCVCETLSSALACNPITTFNIVRDTIETVTYRLAASAHNATMPKSSL